MTKKITLYDRAKADLQSARFILSQHNSDELLIDIAAYHVQQGIEKLAKFALTINGVKHKQTHDMDILNEQLDDAGITMFPWLRKNVDTLNSYATKTRYGSDIVATINKITQLLSLAEELIPVLKPIINEDNSAMPDNLITPS
ncbi:MAG: HEPN domain-containing protein [Defluviitaleaceae bacterium]|nr:HEPN domain-containing protein [Defluviitaleaceae bacterium]